MWPGKIHSRFYTALVIVLLGQVVGLHDLPRTLPANIFYDPAKKVRRVCVGERELHSLYGLNSMQRSMTLSDKVSHVVLFFIISKQIKQTLLKNL